MRPACPLRKYYRFRMEQFNIKLVDDARWKLDLDLFMFIQKKYEKDQNAWTKNRSRTYNLVLQHFPPDVEAELRNQSTWTVGQDEQNLVTLLHMIRGIMHNMKEIKQGVMDIVDCAVKMNTTAQNSSETTEEYSDIFGSRRNTVTPMTDKRDITKECSIIP